MVADSGKNATKMLEAPNELLERNGLERIAIFHRNAQADGSRAEGHLAVAERFRAHDAVTGDADLPEVLVTVARDVLGIVIIHVVWIFGYVTRFKLLDGTEPYPHPVPQGTRSGPTLHGGSITGLTVSC